MPVQTRMSMHVNSHALEHMQTAIADELALPLFLRFILIAKQESTAISCAAWQLDNDRMVPIVFKAIAPLTVGSKKGKPNPRIDAAMRAYHMILGGELAQFASNPTGYCDYAKELAADLGQYKPEESVLVIKPAQ